MICDHCRREATRLWDSDSDQRVCGCCSITLARQFPGYIGRDYPNQVNPEKFDPAKESMMGIKYMTETKDPRNQISQSEAARFKRNIVDRHLTKAAMEATVPPKIRDAMAEAKQNICGQSQRNHDHKVQDVTRRVIDDIRARSV